MKEQPFPQKRQPAKRISLKKHESIVNIMEQRIKHLEEDKKRWMLRCAEMSDQLIARNAWIAERVINDQ